MKVLVADDSITVRKIAERQLTEAGFEVVLVASGEQAVACLEQERPDLVISDVIMADCSGYDVCAYIRAHKTLASTPVLLISGIVDTEVTRQAASCRADGVLKKPFQGASLKEQVGALLARREETVRPTEATDAPAPPSAAKVYRITEESLQSLRQAVARAEELEGLLAAERARSAELLDRLKKAEHLVSRLGDCTHALRALLAPEAASDGSLVERPESGMPTRPSIIG